MSLYGQSLLIIAVAVALPLGGFSQGSMNVDLVGTWSDSTLPANAFYGNTYNEVWGFTVDGREYGVIGSTNGTHIIRIADTGAIEEVDFIPGADQGTNIVHRDFHHHKGYLYMVCDEGESTLQIADLSHLPDSVELVYDSDERFMQAHNIFIDTATSKLYACSVTNANNTTNDLRIFSLDDPTDPMPISSYDQIDGFHDIYVRNDTAFGNLGNTGLYVFDMKDPSNPEVLGSLTNYPDQDYNHSGWTTEKGDHYYFADEEHGMKMKAVDVSELSNMQVVETFYSGEDPQGSVAHNQIVHDGKLYVSHYHDGFYMWDLSDPASPEIAGYYDTYPNQDYSSFKGAWGVYPFLPSDLILVSDMQSGLHVFDAEQAMNIPEKASNDPILSVHPNPFRDQLELFFKRSIKGRCRIAITDITGKTVFEKELPEIHGQAKLNPDRSLSPGTYFLKIRTPEKGTVHKKLIKTRP